MCLHAQILAFRESHLEALQGLQQCRLVIITSTSGKQLGDTVELEGAENCVPVDMFFGDPERTSYALVHAHQGVLNTIVYGVLGLPQWWRHLLSLVSLGAVLGHSRQRFRGASNNWQQGGHAVYDGEGNRLRVHRSLHPVDFGQPIEDVARALGRPQHASYTLNYQQGMQRVTQGYPVIALLNHLTPVLFVLVVLLVWWLSF